MGKYTHEDFIKRLSKTNEHYINGELEILNTYTTNNGKIDCHCTICDNYWTTTAQILKAGSGCPQRAKHTGYLSDTHPNIAQMLFNRQDGYIVKSYDKVYLDWVCPDCGAIVRHKLCSNVVKFGLCCNVCKETRSLGHRTICAILDQLKINYITEKSFEWSEGRIYDVYIPEYRCIIEVNGIQHYENTNFQKKANTNVEIQQAIDTKKYNMALNNNIDNYIIIDARKSDIAYIIDSIINHNIINSLFDISNINWELVCEQTLSKSKIKIIQMYKDGMSIKQIYDKYNGKYSFNYIDGTINSFIKLNLCDKNRHDRIVCVETNEIFSSYAEAARKYNVSDTSISSVCNKIKNRQTAGKDENGRRLHWKFESDTNNTQDDYVKPVGSKKVICLNTLEVFPKIKNAVTKYPNAKSISDCCRGLAKRSGNVNGEFLVWAYYDDYLKMSQDDIQSKLSNNSSDCKIVCLTTNELFDSYKKASEYFGISYQVLYNSINYGTGITSKNNKLNKKLTWCKYKNVPNNCRLQEVV